MKLLRKRQKYPYGIPKPCLKANAEMVIEYTIISYMIPNKIEPVCALISYETEDGFIVVDIKIYGFETESPSKKGYIDCAFEDEIETRNILYNCYPEIDECLIARNENMKKIDTKIKVVTPL
jgi:hypothetical protein